MTSLSLALSLLPSALPRHSSGQQDTELPKEQTKVTSPSSASNPDPDGDFQPFFAVVSSRSTPFAPSCQPSPTSHQRARPDFRRNGPRHYHPQTHYIFTSDDSCQTTLTATALRTLSSTYHSQTHPQNPKQRHILLDLDDTGTQILNAESLSPDWALTSARIVDASVGSQADGPTDMTQKHKMIMIEGSELHHISLAQPDNTHADLDLTYLKKLEEQYTHGMQELQRLTMDTTQS